MGHMNQSPITANWQSTSPITGFLPRPANQSGSVPSGVVSGTMSGTNTIYSQIWEKSRMVSVHLTVTYSGTPTGTFQVMSSDDGVNFYAQTFNMAPFGAKYFFVQYTNASGSGTLLVSGQMQDWN